MPAEESPALQALTAGLKTKVLSLQRQVAVVSPASPSGLPVKSCAYLCPDFQPWLG